jgi:hypothetical protein
MTLSRHPFRESISIPSRVIAILDVCDTGDASDREVECIDNDIALATYGHLAGKVAVSAAFATCRQKRSLR